MKIYFIGMPGSGKSTLGRPVAEILGLPFIDLDTQIEERERKSIKDIFITQGEDYFRQTESQLLREWAGSEKSFVMATGGGAPCFYGGIDVINETGISIFLDVPVEELLRRVSKNQDRPLLTAKDVDEQESRIRTLFEKRIATYNQAKIILKNASLKSVLDALHVS